MSAIARQSSQSSIETDTSTGYTTLADQLRDSHEQERPPDCKRSDCPGSLSLIEHPEWGAELVICQLCRTTPQGKYIPPTERRSSGSEDARGRGKVPESTFENSGKPRMAGGFEVCYDEDDDRRPDGLDDEYTWDLTTL